MGTGQPGAADRAREYRLEYRLVSATRKLLQCLATTIPAGCSYPRLVDTCRSSLGRTFSPMTSTRRELKLPLRRDYCSRDANLATSSEL